MCRRFLLLSDNFLTNSAERFSYSNDNFLKQRLYQKASGNLQLLLGTKILLLCVSPAWGRENFVFSK